MPPAEQHQGYDATRAVVLGASGFVGRWVARALCMQAAHVSLLVRSQAAVEAIGVTYGVQGDIYVLDLCEPAGLRQLLRHLRPSIIFNLAGYGIDRAERDTQTAYQINASLVQTLCEVSAEIRDTGWGGQDIVHVGSALEYGAIGGNVAEHAPPRPTTLYGQSKLAGTSLLARSCNEYGVKGVTARLFTVYGPGEHQGRLLPSLLEAARTGRPLQLTAGQQQRDFTYVEDIAEGLLRLGLATAKPGEIVNLATGQLTTVRRFVEQAASILHIPQDHLLFGALPTRVEEMEHAAVNLDRLQRLIAWVPPTSLELGIRQTCAFVRR